ncbi:Putative ribonuclease H protein At1g65750 [Linum perenne]
MKNEANRWLSTPPGPGMEEMRVHELLTPDKGQWDVNRLRQVFNEDDIKAITSIPRTGGQDRSDVIIWPYSNNGQYTVRSGYRVLMEQVTNSSHLHVLGDWQKLWGLQLPPRMRVMAWRLAREVVPTRDALQGRHIPVPWECGMCGAGIENYWHLFLDCPIARSCWEEVSLLEYVEATCVDKDGFQQWLFSTIREAPEDRMQVVMAVIWSIWRERNGRVWRNESKPPRVIARLALEGIEEWKRAREPVYNRDPTTTPSCTRWHPPQRSMLKCNVDGALFADKNACGWGMVVRDHTGRLIQFKTNTGVGCPSVKECEAMAVLMAVRQLREDGRTDVIIETDSLSTVQALHGDQDDWTEFGEIIRQCRNLMPSTYSVEFVRREGNEVAHTLARRSFSLATPTLGVASPSWLVNALNSICNIIEH